MVHCSQFGLNLCQNVKALIHSSSFLAARKLAIVFRTIGIGKKLAKWATRQENLSARLSAISSVFVFISKKVFVLLILISLASWKRTKINPHWRDNNTSNCDWKFGTKARVWQEIHFPTRRKRVFLPGKSFLNNGGITGGVSWCAKQWQENLPARKLDEWIRAFKLLENLTSG